MATNRRRADMPLAKPNHELFEELDGHAAVLDCTTIDIIEIAKRINGADYPADAMELMEISKTLKEQYFTVIDIAHAVESGLVIKR